MTQKEIMHAKKKAKECLNFFNIKVPMTKMNILFYHIYTDSFFITFFDVRTKDYYQCEYKNSEYNICMKSRTGKITVFSSEEGKK